MTKQARALLPDPLAGLLRSAKGALARAIVATSKAFAHALRRRNLLIVAVDTDPLALRALIERLHPVTTEVPLIRLGPDGDGGYLVPDDLVGIEAVFSPGVGAITGFETDCAERGMRVFCADGTLAEAPQLPADWSFLPLNLGLADTEREISLPSWLTRSGVAPEADLLLQMDIEGGNTKPSPSSPRGCWPASGSL